MKLKAEGWSTTKEDSTYRSQYLMLNQGDCYVYGYYYISSGGAWVELSEWIKQKLGI